jgi:hypothetical protein
MCVGDCECVCDHMMLTSAPNSTSAHINEHTYTYTHTHTHTRTHTHTHTHKYIHTHTHTQTHTLTHAHTHTNTHTHPNTYKTHKHTHTHTHTQKHKQKHTQTQKSSCTTWEEKRERKEGVLTAAVQLKYTEDKLVKDFSTWGDEHGVRFTEVTVSFSSHPTNAH